MVARLVSSLPARRGLILVCLALLSCSGAPKAKPIDLVAEQPVDIRVALVGDSWVAGQKLDEPLRSSLRESGFYAQVASLGFPGRTALEIAEQMNCRDREGVLATGADVVIIVAGVNDAARHVGADSYAKGVLRLASCALRSGSTALILELPEFGIEQYESQTVLGSLRRTVFRWWNDGGEHDVVQEYRQELTKQLQRSDVVSRTHIVDFDQVSTDFVKDREIYKDANHLNDAGNYRLAQSIAATLIASEVVPTT